MLLEDMKKVFDLVKNNEFSKAKPTITNLVGSEINKELSSRGFNKVKITAVQTDDDNNDPNGE